MEKRLVRLCKFLDISSLCNLQSMVSQTVILATNYKKRILLVNEMMWDKYAAGCVVRLSLIVPRGLFTLFWLPLHSSI